MSEKEDNTQYQDNNNSDNDNDINIEVDVDLNTTTDKTKNKSKDNNVNGIDQESYSSMVNNNAILLSFEGWIKYVEGFTRGLSTTKTVDASSVFDVVGEILEYMKTLRTNLSTLLIHCEKTLEKNEELEEEIKLLEAKIPKIAAIEVIEDKEKDRNKGKK